MQHQSIRVFMLTTLSLGLLVESGGKFEKFDQPEPIDADEEEFAPMNEIEADDECPFAAANKRADDWQMIELPHGGPQFDHVDHLPMIDYTWPISKRKENNFLAAVKRQQYYVEQWKKPTKLRLDARKLFLEKKFHYKPKLVNVFYNKHQVGDQPELKRPTGDAATLHVQQQPIVTMFADKKTINKFENQDHVNELVQQQDLVVQSEKDHPAVVSVTETPQVSSTKDMLELNYASVGQSSANLQSSSRARESFQAAAELAKQLEHREPDTRSNENKNSVEQLFNLTSTTSADHSLLVGWDAESTRSGGLSNRSTSVMDNNSSLESAKFLGFGQMYKTDNVRSTNQQARISCSFGLERDSDQDSPANVTISDVQWARFVGNYDPDQVEPPFECKFRSCRIIELKNDVWTTVHPRPAVQHYLGSQAQMMPSYSVTIHQVDPQRHIGVYRCSAIRQIGDLKQLVYRVVPFT